MALSQRRDIVKSLGNADVDIIIDKVTKIMTKSVISAPITVSSSELMEIMTVNKIRHVIIMKNDVLQGIVSIGDVVKRLLEKLEGEAENLRSYINSQTVMPSHLFLVTFGLLYDLPHSN